MALEDTVRSTLSAIVQAEQRAADALQGFSTRLEGSQRQALGPSCPRPSLRFLQSPRPVSAIGTYLYI